MRQKQKETWNQRGECFDVFRPVNEREEPTEWFVLLYMLWRAWNGLWMPTKEKTSGKIIDERGNEVP